ncbi:MAG: 4-oxalocrotonate tautomerase family protein [ANME-2 cluster archaeon]|nr:4-oxalocrotonate tautomerase family protein [ANME-2 cluster archaeon]
MPVITIEGTHFTREQKKDLIETFTREAARITSIPAQAFVIKINENSADNWGVGGEMLSDLMAKGRK